MITVKKLKEMSAIVPDEALINGYEGLPGTQEGIVITMPDDTQQFIHATEYDEPIKQEIEQPDFNTKEINSHFVMKQKK